MWRILLPQLLDFMTDRNPELKKNLLEETYNSPTEYLISILRSGEFESVIEDYIATCNNANVIFWWSYMQMVHILLLYITLCPRKNCTPRQCTVELSSPNAS